MHRSCTILLTLYSLFAFMSTQLASYAVLRVGVVLVLGLTDALHRNQNRNRTRAHALR